MQGRPNGTYLEFKHDQQTGTSNFTFFTPTQPTIPQQDPMILYALQKQIISNEQLGNLSFLQIAAKTYAHMWINDPDPNKANAKAHLAQSKECYQVLNRQFPKFKELFTREIALMQSDIAARQLDEIESRHTFSITNGS